MKAAASEKAAAVGLRKPSLGDFKDAKSRHRQQTFYDRPATESIIENEEDREGGLRWARCAVTSGFALLCFHCIQVAHWHDHTTRLAPRASAAAACGQWPTCVLAGVFGYDVKGNCTKWEEALVSELGPGEVRCPPVT